MQQELNHLAPWSLLAHAPDRVGDPEALRAIPTLREVAALAAQWQSTAAGRREVATTPAQRALLDEWDAAIVEASRRAAGRIAEIERLAGQCDELARMEYGFLYDRTRHLLAIGYNVGDDRMDPSYYDLLASEARFTSFVAIAQGRLPQEHWFALGRLLTSAGGQSVLLSWSGSMFEYLMPLLVMPTYEGTLLDQTCRRTVERQIAYGKLRGVPWGISESGYNSVDANLNYQYRAFGVPGLGLKRGLAEDLVVAPYASALALMVAPEASCANLQRLAAEGLAGRFGLYEAVDCTPARLPRGQASAVVRSFMAHHQGMILLSLAHLLLDRPMQRRFASDPVCKATLLLLQERVPSAAVLFSQPAELSAVRGVAGGPEAPVRLLDSPNTPTPEVQLLSNGRLHVMVTNAGGGSTRWKDLAVTRWREDVTSDNWGTFCYLRDVASGDFWSTAHQPTLRRSAHYQAIFTEARAEFRRRDNDFETHTEIVVSPEDDIELRRVRITNRSRSRRVIEVTSYAEIVLAPAAADALHPAFSNLFVQTEILPQRQAILCTRRPRSQDEQAPWMLHLVVARGSESQDVSYETDRAAFIGRGRTVASPRAMTDGARLSGSQGPVLDPIVAIRHRITLEVAPDGNDRHRLRHGRDARRRLAPGRKVPGSAPRGPGVRPRVDAQLGDAAPDQRHRVRCPALCPPGELDPLRQCLDARGAERPAAEPARAVRPVELCDLRRPADRPAADRRHGEHRPRAAIGPGARLLALEGPGRGPRHLERGPGRLPPTPPGSDHGVDRGRDRSARHRPAGRDLRAARRAHLGRGPRPAPIGGPGDRQRPQGKPGRAGRAPAARGGAGSRASCGSTSIARKPLRRAEAAGN